LVGAYWAGEEAQATAGRPAAPTVIANVEPAAHSGGSIQAQIAQAATPVTPAAPAPEVSPKEIVAEDVRAAVGASPAHDLTCLADAVYYEARGESADGQAAVAQVVLNRLHNPSFPKSICGVVFQGAHLHACQFSFACDGALHRRREPAAWVRARTIAGRALDGSVMSAVGNATHFHVVGIQTGWGPKLMQVARIGLHVFYSFSGYSGPPERASADGSTLPAVVTQVPTPPAPDAHPGGELILASAVGPVTPSAPAPTKAAPAATAPASPAAASTSAVVKAGASAAMAPIPNP
jgi:spore germination cell wall hydrolase CwlJ-like protein